MFLTPGLVMGLTIMAVGLTILADTLGIADAMSALRYWPIFVVLFGASVAVQSFRKPDPNVPVTRKGSGVFPCLFLFVLLLFFFGSNRLQPPGAERRGAGSGATVAGVMHTADTVAASDVRRGRVAAVMGRSTLDLRQVKLAPGEQVSVDVFVAMGRATIRIPDDWVVDASAIPVMGSVEAERFSPQVAAEAEAPADGPPPRLVLHGIVMMGKVEISS